MRVLSGVLLAMLLSSPVLAGSAKIGLRGEVVPVINITTIVSKPGETKDHFVGRLGVWFRNFTTTSGYEVCGRIAKSTDGLFSVVVNTSNSQISCVIADWLAPGFVDTKESIHSHPIVRRMKINESDRAFIQGRTSSFQRVPSHLRAAVDPREFSKTDIDGGPGYLVTDGKILYQNGPGTSVEVLVLPPYDPNL